MSIAVFECPMPESCDECVLKDDSFCNALFKDITHPHNNCTCCYRHDDCPLIEKTELC